VPVLLKAWRAPEARMFPFTTVSPVAASVRFTAVAPDLVNISPLKVVVPLVLIVSVSAFTRRVAPSRT